MVSLHGYIYYLFLFHTKSLRLGMHFIFITHLNLDQSPLNGNVPQGLVLVLLFLFSSFSYDLTGPHSFIYHL